MQLDFSALSPTEIYHLVTQTVIPRPIAWVLTESAEKSYNLAPFSYFTPVSSNPPLLMFSVGKKPNGDLKDTAKNAIEKEKMVIHIASEAQAEAVTKTAATLEHGESEVVQADLKTVEFDGFPLPRLADCSVAFGCTLYEVKEIGGVPQTLVFAQVETVYLAESVVGEDAKGRLSLDATKIAPLARLGGGEYAPIGMPFAIQRPK